MAVADPPSVEALIVALPESAGSAIYGLVDVFGSTGTLWREVVGEEPGRRLIRPKIVSLSRDPFHCGNGIPVSPDVAIDENPSADIIVVPELWIAPHDDLRDRYSEVKEWLRQRYRARNTIYSVCTGAVLLAASGLLKGKSATSHWAYSDLFRRSFPDVRFIPERTLVFADKSGRIVTAGGATSWHTDNSHHFTPLQPRRSAAYRQSVFFAVARRRPNAVCEPGQTSAARRLIVRQAEDWLRKHFREPNRLPRPWQHAALLSAVSSAVSRPRPDRQSLTIYKMFASRRQSAFSRPVTFQPTKLRKLLDMKTWRSSGNYSSAPPVSP